MGQMTMRERMLAVMKDREFDRIPFVQYDDAHICNADISEIRSLIGKEDLGLIRWSGLYRLEHPNCRFETVESKENDIKKQKIQLHTPKGTISAEKFCEPVYESQSFKKHFITDKKDYEVL